MRHERDGLDVVDDGRHAVEPGVRREWRLEARFAALALARVEQRRLLAADVRAGAAMEQDVDREIAAADLVADVAARTCGFERALEDAIAFEELAADVHDDLFGLDRVGGDDQALDDLERRLLEQHAVLEHAWLGFVAVADEITRPS